MTSPDHAYIYLQPIRTGHTWWLDDLQQQIPQVFGYQTKLGNREIDLDSSFDSTRQQYHSSMLLLQLITRPPADAIKIMGIVNADLYIPILTFVFGEAQLMGIGSVIGLQRLNSIFYGLPEDRALFRSRIVKEAIHELGHTFGLIHCQNQRCVMKSSTYVEDVDQKSAEMCDNCRRQLRG